jgi:hypothetical protein
LGSTGGIGEQPGDFIKDAILRLGHALSPIKEVGVSLSGRRPRLKPTQCRGQTCPQT